MNTTVLLVGVVLKPKPLITIVAAVRARPVVLTVTAGATVATCTPVEPLAAPFVVTIAVSEPAVGLGLCSVTVSVVAVAAETIPRAPLLNVTRFFDATGSKPIPVIVMVVALADRLVVLLVITGKTLDTCTAEPLTTPLELTTAVRLPAFGSVASVTVSNVAVDVVTVPMAPLLKVTMLLPGVVLKPVPAMESVELALASRLVVLLVTTGAETAATTSATGTAVPLPSELVVTTAVKTPVAVGCVLKVTVSEVFVAAVTVPIASSLNTTVLLAIVGSKQNPLITSLVPLRPRLMVLDVTTGLTVATCTAEPLLKPFVMTIAVKLPA